MAGVAEGFRQKQIDLFKSCYPTVDTVARGISSWTGSLTKKELLTSNVNLQLLEGPGDKLQLEVGQPDGYSILSMGLTINGEGDLIGLKDNIVTIIKPYQEHLWHFNYKIERDDKGNIKGDPRVVKLSDISRLRSDLVATDKVDSMPVVFSTVTLPLTVADEIGISQEFNWVDTAIAYLRGEVTAETALGSVVPIPQSESASATA